MASVPQFSRVRTGSLAFARCESISATPRAGQRARSVVGAARLGEIAVIWTSAFGFRNSCLDVSATSSTRSVLQDALEGRPEKVLFRDIYRGCAQLAKIVLSLMKSIPISQQQRPSIHVSGRNNIESIWYFGESRTARNKFRLVEISRNEYSVYQHRVLEEQKSSREEVIFMAGKTEALYEDSLLRITPDALIFKHFYFPCGARCVQWRDIESVDVKKSSLHNGKWRLWGTSDLLARIWFPLDSKRATRDTIFFLNLRGKNKRIGFTAENARCVEDVLRRNNIAVHHEHPTSHINNFSPCA